MGGVQPDLGVGMYKSGEAMNPRKERVAPIGIGLGAALAQETINTEATHYGISTSAVRYFWALGLSVEEGLERMRQQQVALGQQFGQ